jgi:hypothetical protein
MKRKIISALVVLVLFSSCKKIIENTKRNTSPDFELRLTKIESTGNTVLQVDNAVNMIDAVTAATSYSFKNQTVEITMGIQPVTTVTPRLKASIRIFNCTKAADAAGVYQLPADAGKFQLSCTETSGANSIIMSNPFEGKIEIKYDAATNTLNGIITGFHFTPVTNAVQSLVLNGKFNHAAIKN